MVYLCAEGVGGFRNRVDGLAIAKQTSELPITVIPASPDLTTIDDTARLFRTLAEIHVETPISLIIVDTMAQVMPGADENSGKDVGKVLKNLRNLADVVKAPVMLVAHTGKDLSRGERGWSGVRAAADARIEVSRDGDYRCAKIVKQKDGEDGAEFPFKLDTVDLGEDDDGDLITSCVVRHVDTGDKPALRKPIAKLGGNEKLLNDLIIEQLTINDFAAAGEGASDPLPWVQWASVLTAMQSRHPGKTSRPWRDAWKSLSNRPGWGYRIPCINMARSRLSVMLLGGPAREPLFELIGGWIEIFVRCVEHR